MAGTAKPEEVMKTIQEFLKKMEVKYFYNEEDKSILVPYNISDRAFNILVYVREKWITTVGLLIKGKDLPPNLNKEEFYARLLQETFYLNEVTFGLAREGDVVVHSESSVDALTYDNFTVEFQSVVYGITYFVDKIMNNLPLKSSETSNIYV